MHSSFFSLLRLLLLYVQLSVLQTDREHSVQRNKSMMFPDFVGGAMEAANKFLLFLKFRAELNFWKFRYRFSAFWLRSKCSICSYQGDTTWKIFGVLEGEKASFLEDLRVQLCVNVFMND